MKSRWFVLPYEAQDEMRLYGNRLMDAAAVISQAARACNKVVANFVELDHRALRAWFALRSITFSKLV